MRKINTRSFRVATRSTFREINRTIVLNLIREHQPISRAELARRMNVRRAALTLIVRELLDLNEVIETGTAVAARGRRPTLLRIQNSGRLATAVDVRPTQTSLVLADFGGTVLQRDVFPTPSRPEDLARELGVRVNKLLAADVPAGATCHGIGIVVPGMVDRRGGRVLYAPRLGWRDVNLRDELATHVGIPVFVESAPIACALARLWSLTGSESRAVNNFAYVSVSDGVGVGIVVSGEVLRGEAHTAGEFGHVSLDPHGPLCACGRRGCWEAFACNSATSMRYVAEVSGTQGSRAVGRRGPLPAVEEIVRRAKRGERAAQVALAATGREIGRGLAAVVCAINPKRIYVAGEVTAAWDLLEAPLREALVEGTLTTAARETPVFPDRAPGEYRLLGAIALVAAPNYAAPRVG
jgi:predicted NBD/HSP70 family sugar kinase